MTAFRKLLLVTVGAIALCGVQACSSGTELNPQPLPPADPHEPGSADKGATNGGASSGSSGASTPAPSGADAGAEGGDASDCGGDH